jgi:DNA-binding SARP family transcriptional activator
MGLRLLGPVELISGDRSVNLGGARQRIVLAVLGLNANRVVPVDQLIDAVWGVSLLPIGAASLVWNTASLSPR